MDIENVHMEAEPILSIRARVPRAKIGDQFMEVLGRINVVLAARGATPMGAPIGIYHAVDDESFDVEIGIPTGTALAGEGDIVSSSSPAGRAATTVYQGPYDGLPAAWDHFSRQLESRGIEMASPCWERYVNDPTEYPPADWKTALFTKLA